MVNENWVFVGMGIWKNGECVGGTGEEAEGAMGIYSKQAQWAVIYPSLVALRLAGSCY
jgi:hypothetical protein